MDAELVSKLIKNAKDAVIVAVMVGVSVFAALNKDFLLSFILELSERMQRAKVGAVEISFGEEEAYKLNPDLSGAPVEQRVAIRQLLRTLSGQEVERLLHRAEYDEAHLNPDEANCEFENANSAMEMYRWADAALTEKKLFKRIVTPELTENQRERQPGDSLATLGPPKNCYQVALTPLGSNVKSVLVTELSRAFGPASPAEGKPKAPAEKDKTEKRHPAKKE